MYRSATRPTLAGAAAAALLSLNGALLSGGCSLVNEVTACNSSAHEVRVNQRGDQSEFINHPKSVAQLIGSNRIVVAFSSQTAGSATSEVRIALLDASSGERAVTCNGDFDSTLSDPNVVAYAPSVAAVNLTISGMAAHAAVSWIENKSDPRVRVLFVDERGCPLGKPTSPLTETGTPTSGATLAWSPVRKALYVAFHDFKRILLTQYVDQLPQPPLVVASPYSVDQLTTIAFGADGRGLIGWPEHPSGAALLEGEVVIRAALLNPDGTLRAGPDGSAAPFSVPFPANYGNGLTVDFSAAAGPGRFALTAALATSKAAREVVYATELSADDGTVVTPAFRAEPDTGAAHFYPAAAYTEGGALVVAWMTAQHGGAVARVFDPGGAPKFNSVSCDESWFSVGARAREGMQGQTSVLFASDRVWIFHPGQPGYDSFAMGTVGWNMAWSDLWPAK
jgi:hypothetical protein